MMKRITLEDAARAWAVSVIALDVNKRMLLRCSAEAGMIYEVAHYHYGPLVTKDLAEAVAFYNHDPERPAGWDDTPPQEDQTAKKLAAIEEMGYVWDGNTWVTGPGHPSWDK